MRPRDEGRIADDGDAAERHARRLQVVDRLQDRLVHQPHDGAELRRHQPLGRRAHLGDRLAADQRRRDRDRVRDAALVGQQPLQLGAPRPPAGTRPRCSGGGRAADRCPARPPDSRGTARPAAGRTSCIRTARDGSAGGIACSGDQRAPGDVAGIERIELRQQLLAHGRADAVGADQQIGLRAAAVAEMRDHRPRRSARSCFSPTPR